MTLPANLTIRPGGPADAEALTDLHLDCWDDAYTGLVPQEILDARREDVDGRIERWRTILAQGTTSLATSGGRLVGFACAGPGRDLDLDLPLEVHALYARASSWGTGVGHALLERAVGGDDCYLWVLGANERATVFYERHGFRPDGHVLDAPEGRHLRMVRRHQEQQ